MDTYLIMCTSIMFLKKYMSAGISNGLRKPTNFKILFRWKGYGIKD